MIVVDKNNMEEIRPTPTAAELEILNILWENEPLTVKEIHEKLTETKDVGYTTALKIMQNMTAKGLLRREPNGKNQLYFSVFKKEETRGKLLDRFVESAFAGSASKLVMQLLGNKKTSKSEIDEIRRIIDQMETEQNR
jgi:BlaI family transcriptional regulator, penicillinase repressor